MLVPRLSRSLSPLFERHAPPLALHSFPTRRSSDLGCRFGSQQVIVNRRDLDAAFQELGHDRIDLGAEQYEVMTKRSEEHTSELQSLTNLVCRLLLEKKKPSPRLRLYPSHADGRRES